MKILIIEDDALVRETLKDLLELNGHVVLAASDGQEGVALAGQSPEFIFCDVNMPRMDGYATIGAIRSLPGAREIPFVFLSAKAERDDLRRGMDLGADDYITKPFCERDIVGAIAARSSRKRSYQERIEVLANQRRHEINAQWSHELLTPLNAMFGCLGLLEAEADTIERSELRELLATIRAGAERQERLSLKLIRYFELEQLRESGRGVPGMRCDARQAVEAGADRAVREAATPRSVRVNAAACDVPLRGEFLSRAVFELVENALVFSPPESEVRLDGSRTNGAYRIEVVDTGPGLSAEQRAGFGAFVQFERSRREQQGLGLGLAIARATAALCGGSFTLEPGAAGRGLRAVFSAPVAPD